MKRLTVTRIKLYHCSCKKTEWKLILFLKRYVIKPLPQCLPKTFFQKVYKVTVVKVSLVFFSIAAAASAIEVEMPSKKKLNFQNFFFWLKKGPAGSLATIVAFNAEQS